MKISLNAMKEIRSFALRHFGGYSAAPIELEDNKLPPYWKGHSFHFENKSGDLIRHPTAYRKAWGKPIYIRSTRRIVVGKDWVKQLEIDLIQLKLSRQRKKFVSKELAEFIFHFGGYEP
jgi:hypothetical protein